MTDIALRWDMGQGAADLLLNDGDLQTDDGLMSAVIISLFSDARARVDDLLPDAAQPDRRGWWGDSLAGIDGDETGSRLWLLAREKRTADVLVRAEIYAREALAWLITDQIAASVNVEAVRFSADGLGLGVVIVRPGGPGRLRFDFAWTATALETGLEMI